MKLLEIVPHLGEEASGPTYSVVALSQELARQHHEVTLLSVNGEVAPAPGFEHRALGEARWPRSFGRSREFGRAALSIATRSDVIHAHGLWSMPSVYAARAARDREVPFVISPRGCLSAEALRRSALKKKIFWTLFYRSAFAAASCIHATSIREFDDVRAFGLKGPVAVLPNGVQCPPEHSAGNAERSRTILFLGRIHPIKGLDVLLPAWRAAISAGLRGWTLRVVGPGDADYLRSLQKLCKDLGVSDTVQFAPAAFGASKWREYRSASITVLPSRTENFGMTVAESLAAGTPVIASKGTPWRDLDTERCGWWVDLSGDSMAGALLTATCTSANSLTEMGDRGRNWMARSFSWVHLAFEMARVYDWICGRCPPPPCVRLD